MAASPSDRSSSYNARVLSTRDVSKLKAEMAALGSELPGVARMGRKVIHFVVQVHNLRTPAVLILKEEMLAKGGDCAIHRDAITRRVERSDCLLMGSEKAFAQMLADLRAQPFGLPRLADEIGAAIESYKRPMPLTPSDDSLPERLRPFYAAMRERTLVMGVLNVTPDSFSDGGRYAGRDAAVEHGVRMAKDGADMIDVGGESSRPGAVSVSPDEEASRVVPVIRALAERTSLIISIDTYKPEVARAALDAGASIINDITGLADEGMRALAAESRVPTVIMHMQGTPQTMQENPVYEDVVSDIMAFLRERIAMAVEAGVPQELVIVDPGIGFGKTIEHNLEILRNLADFKSIGQPILVGTSRKAFIGRILGGLGPSDRLEGTAATVALSIANGANIVRVHDVREMVRVARVADAVGRL